MTDDKAREEALLVLRVFKDVLVKRGMTEEDAEAELRTRFFRGLIDHLRSIGQTDDQIIEVISAPDSISRVNALRLMAQVDRFPEGPYPFTKNSDEKDAYDESLQSFGLTEEDYANHLREEVYTTEAQVFEHIALARELLNHQMAHALPLPGTLLEKFQRYGFRWSLLQEALHIPLCRINIHDWGRFVDGEFCYWCHKKRAKKVNRDETP